MSTQITGSDGHIAIYDPDGRWTTWALTQIYLGGPAQGRYVPKVNDYVVDLDTNEWYRVSVLNSTSLVPTLVPIAGISSGEFTEADLLLGVGPGTQADTYRVYIDNTVMPHTLTVDQRLTINGTAAVEVKIYRGSLLDGSAEVISKRYDQNGTLLSESIPLEAVTGTVKVIPTCFCTEDIPDGEVLTAVAYSAGGHVVSKRQLLAENTAFIRSASSATKYITSISLESPFLSTSNPKLLQYPMNVPLQGLSVMGVVNYSDGSKLRLPIDGTKFTLFGLNTFVASVVGQKVPLVLTYALSAGEAALSNSGYGEERFISENYQAQTMNIDGSFTPKLYGYPVWINETQGYRLEWFLYNLERNVVYNATPHVTINSAVTPFDPKGYGLNQHLNVSVNLKDVNGSFKSYIHTQNIDIVLAGKGDIRTTNWTIGFEPGQSPQFGANNSVKYTFINSNSCKVKLDLNAANQTDWLERLYYRTKPLTDALQEVAPPVPTHFAIVLADDDVEFPISMWDSEHVLPQALTNNGTLFVKFIKRTADSDIHLAIAGIPIWQQN